MSNGSTDYGRLVLTPRLVVGLAIALFGVLLVLDRSDLDRGRRRSCASGPPSLIVLGALDLRAIAQGRRRRERPRA